MILTKRGRMATGAVFAASLALALTACGSSGSSSSSTPSSSSGGSVTSPASPGGSSGSGSTATDAVHTVSNSSLGTIVVDGKGMTVYRFDMDKQNAKSSACTGQCATLWPAVPAGEVSSVTGVDQKLLGSITGTDGKPQLTVDGWPLYTFTQDSAAGDTNGQGFEGIWWAVTPAGAKAAASASGSASSTTDSGSSGGSYGY